MADFLLIVTPFLALIASLCVVYAIRFLDVVEREPKRLVLLALIVGALMIIPALFIELLLSGLMSAVGMVGLALNVFDTVLVAPVAEELLKGMGILVFALWMRSRLDSLTDYIVYACSVGIGFEFIENMLYLYSNLSGKDVLGGWLDEFNNRVLSTAGGHAFFSVWLGLACWILFRRKAASNLVSVPLCIVMSIGLHMLNNGSAVLITQANTAGAGLLSRLGGTLAAISQHLDLAAFLTLIGFAVLRDVRFLIDYVAGIQARLFRSYDQPTLRSLTVLQELSNPINHLLASSAWSWSLSRGPRCALPDRSLYRRFAMLALKAARRDDPDTANHLLRSTCVNEGVELIESQAY